MCCSQLDKSFSAAANFPSPAKKNDAGEEKGDLGDAADPDGDGDDGDGSAANAAVGAEAKAGAASSAAEASLRAEEGKE